MLETLFKYLNLPDTAFFNKNDFTDNVIQALVESERNYGIHIIGPKMLDLTKHSSLPLYCAWKENNFDNICFRPLKQGTIITSSRETGEIFITPLAANPQNTEAAISAPPFSNSDLTQQIFQYDELWCDLKKGINFPEYNGHFTTFILCGNFISNLFEFTIKNSQLEAEDSPYAQKIKQLKKRLSDKQRVLVSKSEKSPEPPKKPSIRLNVKILNTLEPGRSFIMAGSFCFKNDDCKKHNLIPLHIILSGKTYKTVDIYEILVPLKKCKIKDDMIQGYFGFDIMERFYKPSQKAFYIPDSFCVTVVHKNMIIAPTEILLK